MKCNYFLFLTLISAQSVHCSSNANIGWMSYLNNLWPQSDSSRVSKKPKSLSPNIARNEDINDGLVMGGRLKTVYGKKVLESFIDPRILNDGENASHLLQDGRVLTKEEAEGLKQIAIATAGLGLGEKYRDVSENMQENRTSENPVKRKKFVTFAEQTESKPSIASEIKVEKKLHDITYNNIIVQYNLFYMQILKVDIEMNLKKIESDRTQARDGLNKNINILKYLRNIMLLILNESEITFSALEEKNINKITTQLETDITDLTEILQTLTLE